MPDWNALTSGVGVFRETDVTRVFRATLVSSLGVAIAGLSVAALAGYPLAGLGLCAGLAAGAANSRFLQASTTKIAFSPRSHPRRQIGSRTLLRLGTITAAVLVLLVLAPQIGAGALVGIAVFQMLLLGYTAWALLRQRGAS